MPCNTLSSLIVLLFTLTAQAATPECGPAKIKTVNFGKAAVANTQICTNARRDELRSGNCVKNKCAALQINKDLPRPQVQAVGKPGFQACTAAGGLPELIEFQFKRKWFKLDRCLFTQDGSFVDTATLLTLLN